MRRHFLQALHLALLVLELHVDEQSLCGNDSVAAGSAHAASLAQSLLEVVDHIGSARVVGTEVRKGIGHSAYYLEVPVVDGVKKRLVANVFIDEIERDDACWIFHQVAAELFFPFFIGIATGVARLAELCRLLVDVHHLHSIVAATEGVVLVKLSERGLNLNVVDTVDGEIDVLVAVTQTVDVGVLGSILGKGKLSCARLHAVDKEPVAIDSCLKIKSGGVAGTFHSAAHLKLVAVARAHQCHKNSQEH